MGPRTIRELSASRTGNVSLLMALALTGLTGLIGFAVEAGRLQSTAVALQDIADASALAAAVTGQTEATSDAAVVDAGEAIAASMLPGRYAPAKVTVNVESRKPSRAEASISLDVPMIFGRLLGIDSELVTRTAVALSQPGLPVCLLVLEPKAAASLRLKGSPKLVTDNCAVHVNSTAASALSVGGAASVDATTISIAGPASADGKVNPKPLYDQPVQADPLEGKMPWPSAGACANTNFSAGKGKQTLKPGVYCGGMQFASGADATLSPGVYVVQSGSVSFSANARVTGPGGVTLVLLDPKGAISLQGGPQINLQAPTSGPWAGIVVAVKPQPTTITSSLQGGGGITLGGVVYMPSQHLDMQGGGDLDGAPASRGFVVRTIDIQGNGVLSIEGDQDLLGQQANPRLVS